MPASGRTIPDWKIRRLPRELRRELYLYVPRTSLTGMSEENFRIIMRAHGREDLGEKVLEILENTIYSA